LIARKPLQIFLAVQKALFLRELGMRLSVSKVGLFWTFFEPFFQILVFVLIKVMLFGRVGDEFDFAVFLALNFTAFNMFKNIVIKATAAFGANKALFIYKQVKPIDTIFARTLIEVFVTAIIIVIFLCIGFYFEFEMHVKDLTMVVFGFTWLIVFSLSIGVLMGVLNLFTQSVGKFVGFSMRILMYTSAVFYTIEMLPIEFQNFLLYNPLVHFMELIHGSYFFALDDGFVSYSYILLWTIIPLYIGLWLYLKFEERIISS